MTYRDDLYQEPLLPDIVDVTEIASRLEVKKATVHMWRSRGILPEPTFDLAVGPVWFWATIEDWAIQTDRL